MTESATIIGETMHFLVTGITYTPRGTASPQGEVSTRGDEIVVTQDLLDANTDRNGRCFFSDLHSEAGQVARFGRAVIAPGPRPDGMLCTEPGSIDHELARARERRDAYAISDPHLREATLTNIRARYGDSPRTSRTLATLGGPG